MRTTNALTRKGFGGQSGEDSSLYLMLDIFSVDSTLVLTLRSPYVNLLFVAVPLGKK